MSDDNWDDSEEDESNNDDDNAADGTRRLWNHSNRREDNDNGTMAQWGLAPSLAMSPP